MATAPMDVPGDITGFPQAALAAALFRAPPVYAVVLELVPGGVPKTQVLLENCIYEKPNGSPITTIRQLQGAVIDRVLKVYSNCDFDGDPRVFSQDPRDGGSIDDRRSSEPRPLRIDLAEVSMRSVNPIDGSRGPENPYFVLVTRKLPEGRKRARDTELQDIWREIEILHRNAWQCKPKVGSVVVSSNVLRSVAVSRGKTAVTRPESVGIALRPATQTVKLTLTGEDYLAARAKNIPVQEDPYLLGFCRLPSGKYLVQPLLTQLLEKVVVPYEYVAFDVHDKQTGLFNGGMPDNLIVRSDAKQIREGAEIPDLVEVADREPAPETKDIEEGADGRNEAEPIKALTDERLKDLGITPDRIGVIVEGTPYGKADTPDAHNQLLTYMRDFLMHNPLRQHVVGMLTDLQIANFYMLKQDPPPGGSDDNDPAVPQLRRIHFLGQHSGERILQFLRELLRGDGDLLNDKPLKVQLPNEQRWSAVECVQRLGRGGFGRVLHVNINNTDYAMKIPFTSNSAQHTTYDMAHERQMTEAVAGQSKHVPRSVFQVDALSKNNRQLLLMTPVGVPHSRRNWTKKLFIDLLDGYRALYDLLQRKLVHRDILPSNIILADDAEFGQRLVLIDWGCAVFEGAHGLYAGSRAYAACRLYRTGVMNAVYPRAYEASSVDDYGSFLLTAAATFFMPDGMAECCETFEQPENDVYSHQPQDWISFWQTRLPPAWWAVCTELADVQDVAAAHEKVHRLLAEALPPRPTWA